MSDATSMDPATELAVANALDTSIADVAAKEFSRLSRGLSHQEVAEATVCSLDSLGRLQGGLLMPRYDQWDALFYLTWYQPAQVNLAYTLARTILQQQPHDGGSLQVFDYGCGALAMQFGLALAAADRLMRRLPCPRISIATEDDSDAMSQIGDATWLQFIEEIVKYPELEQLRRACSALTVDGRDSPMIRWLTALHVAYKENHLEVAKELNDIVEKQEPNLVLVTAHPKSARWAYSLDEHPEYRRAECSDDSLGRVAIELSAGKFERTFAFRRDLYCETIVTDSLSQKDKVLLGDYLPKSRGWRPGNFKSICRLYLRR